MVREVDRVVFGDGLELVILDVREQTPRKSHRAQALIRKPVFGEDEADLVIDKAHIERRIVRNEYGIADEFEKIIHDVGKTRCVCHHLIVDARKCRDEGRDTRLRVYERLKRVLYLKAFYAKRTDLGNSMRLFCSRSFKVENDELGLGDLAVEMIVRDKKDCVFAKF